MQAHAAHQQEGQGGGGSAVLRVLDSGPGVAPDQRESIFERFRQGPAGLGRLGGTGLGLAIAKDFVELHGGAITVTDAPNGGAAFAIELPLVAERRSTGRPSTFSDPGIAIDIARQTVEELCDAVAAPASPVSSSRQRTPPDAPPAEMR